MPSFVQFLFLPIFFFFLRGIGQKRILGVQGSGFLFLGLGVQGWGFWAAWYWPEQVWPKPVTTGSAPLFADLMLLTIRSKSNQNG